MAGAGQRFQGGKMKTIRPKRLAMKKRSTVDTKKAKVPRVGLFFVVNGKPWVEGIPWAENLSVAGFRTYGVGHPEYWQRLQELGAVPQEMAYDEAARGRVDYEDASDKFTLFADSCIIRKKQLVNSIMRQLCLPRGTRVLADEHYRCPKCLRQKPASKQEKEDWSF
jgi:hypothetical protein